jgi:hypothetical protein|tara:strand:- start:1411 stop:2994 length:1584 start_codon:yes stop_codon:yes gene_type:complete
MAIDYLKLFGDDFDTVLKALDDLTPAAERVLLNSLDNMVFDAQTFSTNIQKQISTMTSSGMSRGAIASSLNTDMKSGGRIFGQLKNNIKSGVVEGVQETAKLGQYDNYDLDKGNFAWVTVGGHKVCADCDGRAGDVGTFNYHETEGLPGAGWSVCQAYCYCVLDPTGKLPKKVQGVPVREKRAGLSPPKVKPEPAWKKTFSSKNTKANTAFQDTFKHANDKFKKFLTKLPEIRHIDSGTGGSYFTEAGLNIKGASEASKKYARRYGRINMAGLDGAYNSAVIRHEFGHFIHHNIHHRGIDDYLINNMLKDWKLNKKKFSNNPKKYLKESEFGELWINGRINALIKNNPGLNRASLYDSLEDLLKFDDAFVSTNVRLGNPTRSKVAKEIFWGKKQELLEIRLRAAYGNNIDDIPDWIKSRYGYTKHSIPLDDKFINACIADRTEDMWGMIADLYGAITKEKLGYGHGQSYYTNSGMQMQFHETYANLTATYTHRNPIYWEYVKKEMPDIAKHFEDVIDKVNSGKLSVN